MNNGCCTIENIFKLDVDEYVKSKVAFANIPGPNKRQRWNSCHFALMLLALPCFLTTINGYIL